MIRLLRFSAVVVLFLLGSASMQGTLLAMPPVQRTVLSNQMVFLNLDAKPYTLDTDSLAEHTLPLEVSAGWQLSAEPPIRFSSDGVCTGGVLSLQDGPRIYRRQLDPPLCRPREYRR